MSSNWIDHDPFFSRLTEVVKGHKPVLLELPGFKKAAVLILVWRQDGAPHLIFIRRSQSVRHHKGEISFPGGVWEPGDVDLCATAIREAQEEVGICPQTISVLGRLDDSFSFSRYAIAPFVAVAPSPQPLSPNREVAEILAIPLPLLLSPDRFSVDSKLLDGEAVPVYTYEIQGLVIWGATARIVKGFLELLTR
ncbi:MAG: NUDIX hydrolase [Thermodesulfobacteriota bacterium]